MTKKKNPWMIIANKKGITDCLLETRDNLRSSIGAPSREYMAYLDARVSKLLNMENNTDD